MSQSSENEKPEAIEVIIKKEKIIPLIEGEIDYQYEDLNPSDEELEQDFGT